MMFQRTMTVAVVAVMTLGTLMLPNAAAAQVKPDDAKAFLGGWSVGLETPQGNMVMNLTIKDAEGKVAGQISNEMMGDSAISDVSKAGEALVLKYTLDFQGQAIPAKITMTPEGDKMGVTFDFADGQFTMPGTATKQ
jgi:hypothetical protein